MGPPFQEVEHRRKCGPLLRTAALLKVFGRSNLSSLDAERPPFRTDGSDVAGKPNGWRKPTEALTEQLKGHRVREQGARARWREKAAAGRP
jgi:hypothetical protein